MKECHCQTLVVFSLLFSWWGEGIQLAGCQIFHSLTWLGDEQDCTVKSHCFEIYQTSEERWKIPEVFESEIQLQEF